MNIYYRHVLRISLAWSYLIASSCVIANQFAPHENAIELIERYMDKNKVSGMAIALVKGNTLKFSKGFGYANLDENILMNADSIMNIGSISKTITATAIMQLWEKGKLRLDKDINAYLPINIRNPLFPQTPITIRHLLTHTSSIDDSSAYGNSYQCGDPDVNLETWVRGYFETSGKYYNEKENFHSWKPGSSTRYSNVAYGLLGYIVEELSSQTFEAYTKTNIFEPLEMKISSWFLNDLAPQKLVRAYVPLNDENKNGWISELIEKPVKGKYQLCNYSFYNYPDSLLRTSVQDLSKFLSAILNKGQSGNFNLLKETTISKMLTPQKGASSSQGLCWRRLSFESLWGHSGGDPGITTRMHFDPNSKLGLIIFQNSSSGDSKALFKQLYRVFK